MTYPRLRLRHLCFTGPKKEPAVIRFGAGLNVLYGASETGKSFVLEAIDFMLGGNRPLRDIGEREGYDRLLLGMETGEGDTFTLVRAASGGRFQVFQGLHETLPEGHNGQVLPLRSSAQHEATISAYLLERIGLAGSRILKSAKSGELINLSFRNIAHLCLVSEEQIHKVTSPVESGQVILKTPEYGTFKLLLTGVDDSAVISASKDTSATQSRNAKVEMLDELLADLRERVGENGGDRQEAADQLERFEMSLSREERGFLETEEQYQALVQRRSEMRRRLEVGVERRSEVDDLLARFRLLSDHYATDLARLEAIAEAGSLVAALSAQSCPLCGAAPDAQHLSADCDGNLEAVVAAADAERAKIIRLQEELKQTITELSREAGSFDGLLPQLRGSLNDIDNEIRDTGPELAQRRSGYRELIDARAEVRASLALWDQVAEMEAKRAELGNTSEDDGAQVQPSVAVSTTTLDRFAQQVERVLKAWHFPDAERVHFDKSDRDLIINGRLRGSRGKGMRAITHAAFTIGLMEYCVSTSKPHPGFVVLDSPLLAYREPEGTEDDLDGTDVQEALYDYLAQWMDMQALVIENTDPPVSIRNRANTLFFSKNPHQGRYGLFDI
jgi:hypothetical protein